MTDAGGEPARRPGRRVARRRIRTRSSCRSSGLARGLVPRLLARHLGRRTSGARRVHVRGRAEPGPAPQFVIPSISETAATPRVGRRALADVPARDDGDRACSCCGLRSPVPSFAASTGTRLRAVSIAFVAASAVGARRDPRSICLLATAEFALRSCFDLGALVPLFARLSFGRGYVDLELCFALFVARRARGAVGRPAGARAALGRRVARARRRGACGRARRCVVPGLPGTPARRRRAGCRCCFDWPHLAAGSIWIGGLIGLLVLWSSLPADSPGRGACRRGARASRYVAFVSVYVLIASGIAAVGRPPTDARLALADVVRPGDPREDRAARSRRCCSPRCNLLRDEARASSDARRRRWRGRGCCGASSSGEVVLVVAAIFAAAVLSRCRRRRRRSPPSAAPPRTSAPGRCHARSPTERLPIRVRGRPEPGGRAELVRASRSRGTESRSRARTSSLTFVDARHGDGPAGVPADARPRRACTRTPRRRS